MKNSKYHLIFDFDGVLGDTEYDTSLITRQLAAEHGFVLPVAEVHRLFSGYSAAIKFNGIAAACGGHFNEAEIEALVLRHEAQKKALYTRPAFPLVEGVITILDKLKSTGHRLSVATSNADEIAKLAVEKAGLSKYFNDRVFGCNTAEEKKPNPYCYQNAITAAEQDMPGLMSIGIEDSIGGLTASVQACDFSIGLLDSRFGNGRAAFQKTAEMSQLGAFKVIRNYKTFQRALNSIPPQP